MLVVVKSYDFETHGMQHVKFQCELRTSEDGT